MALRDTTFLTLDQVRTWCGVTPGQLKTVSALVASGSRATATIANHGFRHGDTVVLAGATQTAYNGTFPISLIDASSFSYQMSSSPVTPATGAPTARSDQDALLTLIADRVCAALERDTSRIFLARLCQERLHGTGLGVLYLKYFPIVAVASLVMGDVALVAETDYVLEGDRGVIRLLNGARFDKGVGNIAVEYEAGYEDDEIPSDVVGCALDICRYYHQRITTGAIAASTISIGGSNVNIIAGLPQDLRNDLRALQSARMVGI